MNINLCKLVHPVVFQDKLEHCCMWCHECHLNNLCFEYFKGPHRFLKMHFSKHFRTSVIHSNFAAVTTTTTLYVTQKIAPGTGHLNIHLTSEVGHLNWFWCPGEGSLTTENQKNKMPRRMSRGKMLMFRMDRYIREVSTSERVHVVWHPNLQ